MLSGSMGASVQLITLASEGRVALPPPPTEGKGVPAT